MGRVSSAIPKTLLTTTGDIIAASAANTPARVAAPASGLVLTGQGAGVLPAWAAASAGQNSLWNYRVPGEWYSFGIVNGSYVSWARSANQLIAVPLYLPVAVTATAIGIQVLTLAAGNARLGIYNSGATSRPSSLVLDAGTVDLSTTGVKSIAISQVLVAGLYFLAFVANVGGGTPEYQGVPATASPNILGRAGIYNASPTNGWVQGFAYAPLPNPFGGASEEGGNIIAVAVKI